MKAVKRGSFLPLVFYNLSYPIINLFSLRTKLQTRKKYMNEFKRTISTLYQLVEHPNNLSKEKVTIEHLYKHPIEQFEIFVKGKISLSEQWCLHLIIQYGTCEKKQNYVCLWTSGLMVKYRTEIT